MNTTRTVSSGALAALALFASGLGFVIVAACTTSSGGQGAGPPTFDSGGYTVTNCPNGGVLAQACASCVQGSCASELDAVNSACAAALVCACPLGVDATACPVSSSCSSAVTAAIAHCSACETTCGAAVDSGSGSGGSSGSSSGGSSGSSSGGSSGSSSGSSSGADGGHDAGSDGASDAAIDTGIVAFQSCAPGGPGMTNCGPGGNESCCTSLEVPGTDGGTTFYRTYTNDGTGPTGQADPATVSGFRLDKYLVTVGRFRQFAEIAAAPDGGAAWVPPVGSGKHAHLNGGQGLVDVSTHGPDGGTAFEPGWLASSDANVQPTTANLTSCSNFYTYTSAPGSQELLPINCVTSFEAYAFCIWDGGFLPSEAEWEFAAAGGTQQLEFPWGSTQPGTTCPGTGCEYLIYACDYPSGSGFCNQGQGNIAPVGTATLGAGLWGHLDMAGELWEWNIDWLSNTYVNPCNDCGYFNPSTTNLVVIRGGYFFNPTAQDNVPWLRGGRTYLRDDEIGFRCARTP